SKIRTSVQPGAEHQATPTTRSSYTRSARFTGPQGASGTRRMHLDRRGGPLARRAPSPAEPPRGDAAAAVFGIALASHRNVTLVRVASEQRARSHSSCVVI